VALTAAAFAGLLLATAVVSTWLAVRAARAEQRAVAARDAEAQQRRAAEEQRDRAVKAERLARDNEARAREAEKQARQSEAELNQSRLQLSQKIVILLKGLERQQAEVDFRTTEFNRFAQLEAMKAVTVHVLKERRQDLAIAEAKKAEIEAELSQLQELALRRPRLGLDHPDTLASLAHLAAIYENAQRWADAEGVYKELIALQRRKGPAGSPELAAATARLSRSLLHQKKYTEAETLLREGLAARAKGRPDDCLLDDIRGLLGESLLGQKKYAEAEPLLLRGYEGLKQREARVPPAEKALLAEALVRLYEATGRKDRADVWRKKLEVVKPTQKKAKP
jgi:TolA-binding protein